MVSAVGGVDGTGCYFRNLWVICKGDRSRW